MTRNNPKASSLAVVCTVVGVWLLGGCATNQGYLSPDTGRALKEAYARQIVDPTPDPGAPSVTPEVAAAAIQRYLDDAVKDPADAEDSFSSGD